MYAYRKAISKQACPVSVDLTRKQWLKDDGIRIISVCARSEVQEGISSSITSNTTLEVNTAHLSSS